MAYSPVGTDAFTDVAGTLLTAHSAKWLNQTGGTALQIPASGVTAVGSTGGRTTNYWSDAVTATQYAKTLLKSTQDSKVGPAIRMQSGALSYYYALWEVADSKVYAGQTVAGSSVDWDSGQAGFSLSTDQILLEVDPVTSTTIYLKKITSGGAPSLVATFTGKSALSGGFVGIVGSGGANVGVTSWEGGNIVADGAAPLRQIVRSTLRLN